MVKKVDPVGLRIARLAYVMHYSLGTQAHMMRKRRLNARLCARLGKVFGARPHPATITYNAKALVLAARQHVLQSLATRWIATRLTKEWQPTARTSLVRCICPAQKNSVAAPFLAKRNKNACSTIARAARSNEPFHIARTGGLRTDGWTDGRTDGHIYPGNRNPWQDF
jgi:hypothetical protein